MAEPLKNLFSTTFFAELMASMKPYLPNFSAQTFLQEIYSPEWENLELKQRMRHVSTVWGRFMPDNYSESVEILIGMTEKLLVHKPEQLSFAWTVLPDFIEVFGQNHYAASIRAMETVTQYITCEFAVRPFLILYPDKMMAQMLAWSKHESLEVRRFSTEGMRSRLPWAAAVPTLKKNPAPILPILENLKQDPADWVRLSVSNNLNDISKDHPELAKKLARSWYSLSPQTGKLVKHGLRTLLKKGDAEALRIIGVADASGLEVSSFAIENPRLRVGEDLWFTFSLKNTGKTAKTIRLEYGVYYMKANGTLSRKVFKLSEGELAAGAVRDFRRKQHFRPISTRKYHGGEHRLSIIVNGEEKGMEKLELLVSQE